jgi:cell division protein FtsL
MNALAFLLIAVVVSAIGSAVLVLRQRKPTSLQSSIEAFRAEMDALAPSDERRPTRR